jgi:nicotinate (nicotinamide) nucleotide adenylyltransferase
MDHPTTPGISRLHLTHPAPRGVTAEGGHRLGILGGAYNPITFAHLALADAVVHTLGIHEVLFCLPEVPPHKTIFGASLEQRLEMMQLAVADIPYASVGLSTHGLFIDIYQAVCEVYPASTEVFFLTGRDAAERILTWDYDDTESVLQQMFTAFQLIVCDRDGAFEMPDDPRLKPYHDRIYRCAVALNADHISSTTVRERLQQGGSIDDLVPGAVADYIRTHSLYTD